MIPFGRMRISTIAASSSATSPKTGLVAKVAIWLMTPNRSEADAMPASGAAPPPMHGDEGVADIGAADGREHAGHRRKNAAGEAGERCAECERHGVDREVLVPSASAMSAFCIVPRARRPRRL